MGSPIPPEPAAPSLANQRWLVTGGAGFIGSNLTRLLLDAGAAVTVVDNFSTGRREHLPAHDRLTVVEADLRTTDRLDALVAGADFVVHLAAQVGNIKSIADAVSDASTNVMGTVRLLQACRGRASMTRCVYASSSAIFGEARTEAVAEDHPDAPASFYALSKLATERYARLAHTLWDVPTVGLRFFNVYGLPMEDNEYTGVISIFLRRARAREPLIMYGDGAQVRDFVHVQDVARAIVRAALHGPAGAVYNIGTGTATSIAQLARTVLAAAGRDLPIEHRPARAGEVRRSVADIALARRAIGYAPAVALEDGLRALWTRLASEMVADGA